MDNNPTKDYDYMEESVLSPDEIVGNDISIRPDYYIHTALLRAQKVLMKENAKDAFLTYCVYINHIEVLAKSAGRLPDDYDGLVKDFKEELKKDVSSDRLVKDTKMANFKLGLMMKNFFNNTVISSPLKTG